MGNESSTLASGDTAGEELPLGGECCGFRVLGIQEQSPAAAVGFVSFFDFILEANGIRLDTRDATLMELIAQSEDRPLQLSVYNAKAQTTRALQLTPSRRWPGKGLLGVTIRFDSYERAEDQLLHVLHVAEDSPAQRAGLRADSDYLLGTPERVFADAEDLHDEILDALDGSFQCYVYNSKEDQVRIVSIVPTERWGGEGVLGAEVGHGYLHRLPSSCRSTIGSSVGFVKLPKDAKAATDAFLKQQRRQEQVSAAMEEGTAHEIDVEQNEGGTLTVEQQEQLQDVAGSENDQSGTQETPSVDSQQPEIQQQEIETRAVQAPDSNKNVQAVAPSTKPRYTARMDHQFPMSTVAVLADP